MKRIRVLLLCLAAAALLCLLPKDAQAATTHSHPVCGNTCKCSDSHDDFTWQAWDGTTTMYNGNYYLTKDLVLDSTMILNYSYTTRLCLNGHSITCADTVFSIYSYRQLLITDCVGSGRIESTNGSCAISNNKHLTLWGGTIRNSNSEWSRVIEAYANTTTYICGGKIESVCGDAFYGHSYSSINVMGGTVQVNGQTGVGINGEFNLEMSGGKIIASSSTTAVQLQRGSIIMSGGYVEGCVSVYDSSGSAFIKGGTIDGIFETYCSNCSITGGTMSLNLNGATTVSAGTFKGTCYLWSEDVVITGGDFSACDNVMALADTWICGGTFNEIEAQQGTVYLSGIPSIEKLKLWYPNLVSAQSEDATATYSGDPIEVVMLTATSNLKDGDVIIKNVKSDAVAQRFILSADSDPWIYLERYNNNLVVRIVPHGTWGSNVTWGVLDGVLTISGKGAIDYTYSGTEYPWGDYADEITSIVVEPGITDIPKYAFEYCEQATSITLPDTLKYLALNAFNDCGSLKTLLLPASLKGITGSSNTGLPAFIRCESLTDVFYLGTMEEWSAVTAGKNIESHNSEMTLHFLQKVEGTVTCTSSGVPSYYRFDDNSFYTGMYDMDKKSISKLQVIPALGHRVWVSYEEQVDPIEVTNSSTVPFVLSNGMYYSANHEHNSSSELVIEAKYACNLTLQCNVSSETNYDKLYVFYNDVQKIGISGNVTNRNVVLTLAEGDEVIVRYSKDGSGSRDSDQGWVKPVFDQITLTGNKDVPADTQAPDCTNAVVCSYCQTVIKAELGHQLVSHEGSAPTCIEGGWAAYETCNRCAYTSYKELPAAGHSGDLWFELTQPNCTEAGIKARICSTCGETETQEIPALGHSYSSVVTAPTCTEAGFTTHTCSACGDAFTDATVAALGHSYGEWSQVQEPDCTNVGKEQRICACGATEERDLDALGHSYSSVVTKPTCTKEGFTTHTCSVCGDAYTDTPVAVLGHSFGDWTQTLAPTCTELGKEQRVCETCGTIEEQDVAALGHTNTSVVTEPTCTEEGYTTNTCSVCGAVTTTDIVAAKGHGWSAWIQTVAPSCTKEGSRVRFCNCGVRETEVLPKTHTAQNGICTSCGALESYYWILSADANVTLELQQDLYVDLNGFDLTGTLKCNGFKVYGMDSTTDSYICDAIGYMNCTDENGAQVVPVTQFKSDISGSVKRYMAIEDENGYSFHRFYLGITHMSLKPTTVGVGYKAVFYGDAMVAANLDSFGFTMCLDGNEAITVSKAGESFVSGKTVTLRVDNFDVERYGETKLYASVMLKLKDGTVIESTRCEMTMRSMMELLNTNYATLTADQLTAVADLVKKYAIIQTWKVENLVTE